MSEDIRLWKIEGKSLKEISKKTFMEQHFEKELEGWVEKDISLISDDLIVIGRQVETFKPNSSIDILCLDREGNTVIVELKRDKTPRDVVAQTLYYASWVKDLSYESIKELVQMNFDKSLEDLFHEKFGTDEKLPDVLNETHRMLIVASEMDTETEMIIKYLSATHGVDINFIKFQYFRDNGQEILARVFLVEPDDIEENPHRRRTSKSSSNDMSLYESHIKTLFDFLNKNDFKDIRYDKTKNDWRIYKEKTRNVWLRIDPQKERLRIKIADRHGMTPHSFFVTYERMKTPDFIDPLDLEKLRDAFNELFNSRVT